MNYQKIKLISTEVDGSPKEVEESVNRLQRLGFTENKLISVGKMAEAGTVLVFTKELNES